MGKRTNESRTRSADEEVAWQAVRRAVLKRDGNRCRDCGEAADRRDLDVHHLVRRTDGGRDEVSNCITLCDGCHGARHPRLQLALSRRMMERWALRLARWLDRTGELPNETRALEAGLRIFGAERFRDGQLDAVLSALRGESLLMIQPTGAGKSLCFQLPAVLKGQPATFVLSPLKALMVDQVRDLQRIKVPATFINSDITGREKEQRYRMLETGGLSLLYVAPERFNPDIVRRPEEVERLARQRPNFLVVDEAHLVDRWGDDFRPTYSQIAGIRGRLGNPPVLAFTATAGARTQERIKASLGIPDARTLVSDVDRPNIALIRLQESDVRKRALIVARLIENVRNGRVMVFVPTMNVGFEVQTALTAVGCELPFYYGQLAADEQERIFGQFSGKLDPPLKGVICTSAFSMGLNIPDVRAVVNWQHPAAVEDYLQEFGRGGRDGRPALALLFSDGGREKGLLHWMADKTSEKAVEDGHRSITEAQETLRGKKQRIEEMAYLTRQDKRCFRAELTAALAGPAVTARRSAALRVLDRAFSSRPRIRKADACCDICNPEVAKQLRAGTYAPGVRSTRAPSTTAASRHSGGRQGWSGRWRRRVRTRVVVGAIALLALVVGGITMLTSSHDADAPVVARHTFNRYTAALPGHAKFTHVAVSKRGDTSMLACGRRATPRRGGGRRYTLCLLIDPSRPASKRVTGSYRTDAKHRRHACRGAARDQHLCG